MSAEQNNQTPDEGVVSGHDDTDTAADPDADNKALDNVRQLLPNHLLPKTRTGRPVGRPRKINPAPTANDLQYHAQMSEARQSFISEDPVVRTLGGRPDSPILLSALRLEIAKEAASLHFQRVEDEKYGKDTAQTSTRRINALTQIAHIELEIKKLAPDMLDVRSEKFRKVFAMFIETMKEAAQETLAPEAVDLFFNRFGSMMDGWEEKAESLIR